MKFRTDFVTNSSSSNFSLVLSVYDKDGHIFSYAEDPYEYSPDDGGECWYSRDLGNLFVRNIINGIKTKCNAAYDLLDTDAGDRPTHIENVSVGDHLTLEKTPGRTNFKMKSFDYAVDVKKDECSLGLLPGTALDVIENYLESDTIKLIVTVSSVTPLSMMRKNSKKPRIAVSIDAKEKQQGQVILFDKIPELAKYLMDGIHDDREWDDDWDVDDDDNMDEIVDFNQLIKERKDKFVKDVSDNIKSIEDITRITIDREYSAWGEFADQIPDNDSKLCELAAAVINSNGDERKKAIEEMLSYINTPNPNRHGEHFGCGAEMVYYSWAGDENALLKLAERLCSSYGPDSCEGKEHDEIDFINQKVKSYAEYNLC